MQCPLALDALACCVNSHKRKWRCLLAKVGDRLELPSAAAYGICFASSSGSRAAAAGVVKNLLATVLPPWLKRLVAHALKWLAGADGRLRRISVIQVCAAPPCAALKPAPAQQMSRKFGGHVSPDLCSHFAAA